jgi:hypothetical protein
VRGGQQVSDKLVVWFAIYNQERADDYLEMCADEGWLLTAVEESWELRDGNLQFGFRFTLRPGEDLSEWCVPGPPPNRGLR